MSTEKVKADVIDAGLESAFQTAKQKQIGTIMTSPLPFWTKRSGSLSLPAIYPQDECVEAGGLMSYEVDYDDFYRSAAVYVDKILKGAKPADSPVQQATKLTL